MTDAQKTDIRQHVESNHQRLLAVVATLTPADFELPVYSGKDPDKWTVRSVIAHLDAAAAAMLHTAKEIASGQDPLPFDFDLARWNQITVKKAANKPAEILLEKLHRSHQEWLRFLDEIPVAHLHRRGRHGRGDVLSVEGFMRRYANHEARHASEIHEALQRD